MSALALKESSFYGKMIEDLGLMPLNVPEWIKEVQEHFKTEEMCNEPVFKELRSLAFVPDKLKTKEMCNGTVRREPYTLECAPDHLKTPETCNEALRREPRSLEFVPDKLKTEEMGNDAVRRERYKLDCVLDHHLKTQKMCNEEICDNLARFFLFLII